jgi:hypothetical protein
VQNGASAVASAVDHILIAEGVGPTWSFSYPAQPDQARGRSNFFSRLHFAYFILNKKRVYYN